MQSQGAIDCDIHPAVPDMRALLPYMDEYWREHLITRGTERLTLHMTSFPPNAPLCVREDYRPSAGLPGSDFAQLKAQALDTFGTRYAICNVIYAAQVMFNEDMAAVMCRAVNDWVAREWLDRDPRLRAVNHGADPEPAAGRAGDRALRRRSAIRPGADAGEYRNAGRPPLFLADL